MEKEPDLILINPLGHDDPEIPPIWQAQLMEAIHELHPKMKAVNFDGPKRQYGNGEPRWVYHLFYEY